MRSPLAKTLLFATVAIAATACSRDSGSAHERTGPPRKIVSRTVFADELLWAMGPEVQVRVVGLSPMADDARYSRVAGEWPTSTPRLGSNPEELLALAPDLVILASFSDIEYRAAVEDKVEVLVLDDFDGFDGFRTNLERVGRAIGAPEKATELRAAFDEGVAALEAARPPEGARPTIVAWEYGYVAGASSTFDDVAVAAGFRNLASERGISGHRKIDAEELIAWEPEWLVIGCGEQSCDAAKAGLREQPGIRHMSAVTEDRVIAIEPPYLASTGQAMIELGARLQAPLLARGDPDRDGLDAPAGSSP